MSKNLNEELTRIKTLFNFKMGDNAHDVLSEKNMKNALIKEQDVTDKDVDIKLPGNINATGGRVGQTKKEFKQQQKTEKEEIEKKITEGTEAELKKLFIEKFAADLGNRKAFKALPQSLKEELMGAWFTEGGLPKDFWVNADNYKFHLFSAPKEVGSGLSVGIAGDEGKTIGEEINKRYKAYDKENFANYNGKNNTYKYIKTKPGIKKPLIEDGNIVEGTINLEGWQILVIAPKVSDDGELTGAKTTKTQQPDVTINLNVPDLPVGFDVQQSTIPTTDQATLLTALRNAINNNEQIQRARQIPGAVVIINNVGITSSASNQWDGPTPFTHNNDRSPADTSNGNNPDSSTYNTGNVQRNFNLAGQRGNTLQTLLSTDQRFMQALGITDQTNFDNIDARITNTGGQNDPPNAPANTRGQYASFDFEVRIEYPVPDTISTVAKLVNFKVQILKQSGSSGFAKVFSIHFSKAKYLKRGGERKSSAAVGRNLGKSFRGFGPFLDSILP